MEIKCNGQRGDILHTWRCRWAGLDTAESILTLAHKLDRQHVSLFVFLTCRIRPHLVPHIYSNGVLLTNKAKYFPCSRTSVCRAWKGPERIRSIYSLFLWGPIWPCLQNNSLLTQVTRPTLCLARLIPLLVLCLFAVLLVDKWRNKNFLDDMSSLYNTSLVSTYNKICRYLWKRFQFLEILSKAFTKVQKVLSSLSSYYIYTYPWF